MPLKISNERAVEMILVMIFGRKPETPEQQTVFLKTVKEHGLFFVSPVAKGIRSDITDVIILVLMSIGYQPEKLGNHHEREHWAHQTLVGFTDELTAK